MKRISILTILFLSLLLSCNTQPAKESNKQNRTEMEKKNIGNLLALYPKPLTVVGAEVEGKVNWLVQCRRQGLGLKENRC